MASKPFSRVCRSVRELKHTPQGRLELTMWPQKVTGMKEELLASAGLRMTRGNVAVRWNSPGYNKGIRRSEVRKKSGAASAEGTLRRQKEVIGRDE
jgi:hypothetical protein